MSKRKEAQALAKSLGLYLAEWSPGDGARRYKILEAPALFDAGSGLGRCIGSGELLAWLRGYAAAQTRRVPEVATVDILAAIYDATMADDPEAVAICRRALDDPTDAEAMRYVQNWTLYLKAEEAGS